MTRESQVADIVNGVGEPDIQNDVLDNPEDLGLGAETRIERETSQLEALDVLEGLRAMESGDPISWHVYRVGERDPDKNGFLETWPTSMLTQDSIRDHFGKGRYRVRGHFSNGKYAAQRTVIIAGDAPRRDVEPLYSNSLSGSAMNRNAGFDMEKFFALQDARDRQERREAQTREASAEAREERRRKSFLDMITVLTPLAAPVLTALVSRVAPPVPPAVDPVAQLKGLAETMVALQGISGGGEGGDSMVEIIKAVAPHAGPVLAALATRASVSTPRVRPSLPAPGSQPTGIPKSAAASPVPPPQPLAVAPQHTGVNLDAPSSPTTPEQSRMFAQLKSQVDALVVMAREGADPRLTADTFYDTTLMNVDDRTYDQLCDFLMDAQCLQKLSVFNTGVRDHLEKFFVPFQGRLIERINGDDQSPPDAPG